MDITDLNNPIVDFIVDVTTEIKPLEVARWLESEERLSRGEFANYIGGAIQMKWGEYRIRCSLFNVSKGMFKKLCLMRIRHVIRKAEHHDGLREITEFAKYLNRPKKMTFDGGK